MISLTLGARDRQSLVGETEIKHTSITNCYKCFEEQLIGDPESDWRIREYIPDGVYKVEIWRISWSVCGGVKNL